MISPLLMLWCGIVIFLGCSAFFSASETALFSIPRERIVYFRQHDRRSHRWVYELLGNGQRTLLMILLGNLFVNITLTGMIDSLMRRLIEGYSVAFTMGAATALIVIFGEMLPKNIALKHNERIALICAPVLSGIIWCFLPVLHLIRSVNVFFLTRLSLRLRRPSPFVTIDELKSGVIASRNRGAISVEEQDMIVGLLERGTEPVRNFMLHRSSLTMLAGDVTVAAARSIFTTLKESFVVVYRRENTAQVTGIIPVATLLRSNPDEVLEQLVAPLLWVNGTVEIAEIIGVLLDKKKTLAGVTDEYGSFEGVIKLSHSLIRVLSPLLQQSAGEPYSEVRLQSKVVTGDTALEGLEGWFPPPARSGTVKPRTLNGLLTNHLGYIPATGDKFAIDGFNFYIIKANPRKIESVLIQKKESL
ncbi:MAG: DUF21 domain-containing protein [Chitinispirillaceae bacterium]|nr:DUF21 domain-containing protein [Chitinispirillaceae bacterium]